MQSTVLLVDDDPGILQLVGRYFNSQLPEYALVTADSGNSSTKSSGDSMPRATPE
ncbi:hypothetical protein [Schleiferilactobacillus perolens]|jgi:DNA-binding NtrC family response regulator|uniref:hypothetical protein n=1 Tax=Schleiferilactobacillus perolens TaxID=100468 RepID=UPI0023543C9E|nr:hypothetical protein [Schleiferilactobacillus perolens]MCI2170426.1 hypothetical protein [Schleiferilactobacillus perolens]